MYIHTKENELIVAFYQHENETYRVIDKVDDFKVEKIDGSNYRWFSTHSGLTLAADIQSALSSYFNTKGEEAYKHFLTKGIILRPLGKVLVIIPPYCIPDEELKYIHKDIRAYLDK